MESYLCSISRNSSDSSRAPQSPQTKRLAFLGTILRALKGDALHRLAGWRTGAKVSSRTNSKLRCRLPSAIASRAPGVPSAAGPAGEFGIADVRVGMGGREDADLPAFGGLVEEPELAPGVGGLHGDGGFIGNDLILSSMRIPLG